MSPRQIEYDWRFLRHKSSKHPEGRRPPVPPPAIPPRQPGQRQRKNRQSHERVRKSAMQFDGGKPVVGKNLSPNDGNHINIRKHRPKRSRESSHLPLALRKKSLADQRSGNSMSDRIHALLVCASCFDIVITNPPRRMRDLHFLSLRIHLHNFNQRRTLLNNATNHRPRTPWRPKTSTAASTYLFSTATNNPPEVCGSKNKFRYSSPTVRKSARTLPKTPDYSAILPTKIPPAPPQSPHSNIPRADARAAKKLRCLSPSPAHDPTIQIQSHQ